jgi:Guanosine polyphosphate pyrophosphohydrolases/synthetases
MKKRKLDKEYQPKEALIIDGTEGSIVNYPHCCFPLPGDEITGYLSPSKGVVIHRSQCINLQETLKDSPERSVKCQWNVDPSGMFKTKLMVDVINRTGVLANLASLIAAEDVNIVTIDQVDKEGGFSQLNFVVEVESRGHATQLMNRLQRHTEVLNVKRVYHEKKSLAQTKHRPPSVPIHKRLFMATFFTPQDKSPLIQTVVICYRRFLTIRRTRCLKILKRWPMQPIQNLKML